MKLDQVLTGYMRIRKRSEKASPDALRKTFVDVGPLFQLLSTADNQALFGRRGTGKTHVLNYLASKRTEEGDLAVYIDLSNLGSSGSIYSDTNRSVPERATRLMVDTLLGIHNGMLDAVLDGDQFDLSRFGPLLDSFANAATSVQLVGTVEQEEMGAAEKMNTKTAKDTLGFGEKGLSVACEESAVSQQSDKYSLRRKLSGAEKYVLHFGEIATALRALAAQLSGKRLWLLLDEWSNLPLDLQPYLADLLRRTVFNLREITVKIAAIEFRSNFALRAKNNTYIGIELGADMSTDANLDDFMVFDNDITKSGQFHRQLLYNHLRESAELDAEQVPDADELIRLSFSQDNAFSELVRAGEGVPRDFINILSLAAQYSNNERISMAIVRRAALSWYQTGKANTLRAREDANGLLEWIVEDVIKHRKTRAFLVRSQEPYALLDELFDARVIHLIKRRVSSNDMPGVRFDVFKLDYGCYVDLIGTASAPKGLFEAEETEGKTAYVEVPRDDYRSIRRAILDLKAFEQAAAGTGRAQPNPV